MGIFLHATMYIISRSSAQHLDDLSTASLLRTNMQITSLSSEPHTSFVLPCTSSHGPQYSILPRASMHILLSHLDMWIFLRATMHIISLSSAVQHISVCATMHTFFTVMNNLERREPGTRPLTCRMPNAISLLFFSLFISARPVKAPKCSSRCRIKTCESSFVQSCTSSRWPQ